MYEFTRVDVSKVTLFTFQEVEMLYWVVCEAEIFICKGYSVSFLQHDPKVDDKLPFFEAKNVSL